MIRPRLEVAEVFREFTPAFLHRYGDTISPDQRRVLGHVARCRTAELGGHVEECDRCGHRRIAYNSCCNRHCPKCQAAARAQWLDQRRCLSGKALCWIRDWSVFHQLIQSDSRHRT